MTQYQDSQTKNGEKRDVMLRHVWANTLKQAFIRCSLLALLWIFANVCSFKMNVKLQMT